jgi:hypothetical protein
LLSTFPAFQSLFKDNPERYKEEMKEKSYAKGVSALVSRYNTKAAKK